MFELLVNALLICCVSKTTRADNGSALENDAFTEAAALANCARGVDMAVGADLDVCTDECMGINSTVIADESIAIDDDIRAYGIF